jgi:hypothetical protein
MGILVAELAGGLCEQDCGSAPLSGAVFGAALGFTVGALIGGQIRKGEADPDSP